MGLTTVPQPLPDDQAFAAIKAALRAGCNYFNGGEFFGPPNRNSLVLLRKYFEKYPEDADNIVLNIKGAFDMATHTPNGSKEFVSQSIDSCLEALGPVGRIDQFEPARKDLKTPFDETLATIQGYVKMGKVGSVACSELGEDTLRQVAKKYNVTSLEIELSLFRVEPLTNGLLAACAELDILVLAYSPLGKGFLGGQVKSQDDIPEGDIRRRMPQYSAENFHHNLELVYKVEALAKKKGCTPGQVAINWLLHISKRPGMPKIIPIPGSTKPARIRENATIIDLSAEDVADIEAILNEFTPSGTRYPPVYMTNLGA